jgi:hypothetical protein
LKYTFSRGYAKKASEEFGSHPDIEDLGSRGECGAGPAFLREFGRHRYVFVWDYLVLIG